ncbi:hypothetical protein [Microbacterium sp. NPDC055455]
MADLRFLIERARERADVLMEVWGDDAEVRDDARLIRDLANALDAQAT